MRKTKDRPGCTICGRDADAKPDWWQVARLRILLTSAYRRVPIPARWVVLPLVSCLRLLRGLRPEFCIVSGQVKGTELPLTVLCSASAKNSSYLLKMAFGTSFQERSLGRYWLWRLTIAIRDAGPECSLAFVQIREVYRPLLRGEDSFHIPCWVAGEAQVPIDPSFLKAESVKSDLRRIQKHALTYEVTRVPERLIEFYHRMYVPYVTSAHAGSASIATCETLKKRIQDCELVLVRHREQDIAGMLLVYEQGKPRSWLLGVQDANQDYVRLGAVAAAYHFSFQHLAAKGYTKEGLGASRAFLSDGVLQYKKKLGQRIVGSTRGVFVMKLHSSTPATQAFLFNNPFVFKERGVLHGAVFVGTEAALSQKEIVRIDRHYFHPGMSRLFVFCPQNKDARAREAVPEHLRKRITLRCAMEFNGITNNGEAS